MKIKRFIVPVISFMLAALFFSAASQAADFDWEDDSPAVSSNAVNKNVRASKSRAAAASGQRAAGYAGKNAAKNNNEVSGRNVPVKNARTAASRNASKIGNAARTGTQQNVPAKGNAVRRNSSYRKNTAANPGEIDQLPLPPPPSKNASSAKIAADDIDLSDVYDSDVLSKENDDAKREVSKNIKNVSDMELSFSKPAGWSDYSRSRGSFFAMQKNHSVFTADEKKDVCTSESVLELIRKKLAQHKKRDNPSKLMTYAVQDGFSGHYYYLENKRLNNKNYYLFLCAGGRSFEIKLNDADDALFEESISSIKMGAKAKKAVKNQRPKLQPPHFSTEDVGNVIK